MAKRKINKEYILNKLKSCTLLEILTELAYLEPDRKTRLLKEYSLTPKIEAKEFLWKSEKVANRYTLKIIEERIEKRRKYLETQEIPKKTKEKQIIIREGKDFPNFFTLFEKNKKNEVLLAITCLEENEKELLYKKYGKNLDRTTYKENLTNDEKNQIRYNVTRKIKKY